MWDVRAKSMIYELGTGNNMVNALAWDSSRNSLYAATACSYMDRMGYHHGYRRAKMPNAPEEGDTDDYDGEERCWPVQARHSEDHFAYTFDAGDHKICEYLYVFHRSDSDGFQTDMPSRLRLIKKFFLNMVVLG